jgi:non-lysosomal glucosylceramidase
MGESIRLKVSQRVSLVSSSSRVFNAQAYALCTEPPEDGTLNSWQWYPASHDSGDLDKQRTNTGTYHALYPRSWFVYNNVFQTELTCEQFSPIWAGCYQESQLSCSNF